MTRFPRSGSILLSESICSIRIISDIFKYSKIRTIYKPIKTGSTTSLWLRNIQLGLFGAILAFIGMHVRDGDIIREKVTAIFCRFYSLLYIWENLHKDEFWKKYLKSAILASDCIKFPLYFIFTQNLANICFSKKDFQTGLNKFWLSLKILKKFKINDLRAFSTGLTL